MNKVKQHYVPKSYLKAWEGSVSTITQPEITFKGVYYFEEGDKFGDGRTTTKILWQPHLYSISFDQLFICDGCPEVYTYQFDVTTLIPYSHNLNYTESVQLDRLLYPFYKKMYDDERETYKELCERRDLLFFLLCAPERYRDSVIEKQVRPDFVLYNENKRIGVEITELTTPYDRALFTATRQIHENGLEQEEEIREHIKRYHRSIADNIKYVESNGKTYLSSGFYQLDLNRSYFAEKIKSKHDKYMEIISQFDEFIILCHAASGSGLDFSDKSDVQDVIDKVIKICPEIKDTTVVIAWREAKHYDKIIHSWYYMTN